MSGFALVPKRSNHPDMLEATEAFFNASNCISTASPVSYQCVHRGHTYVLDCPSAFVAKASGRQKSRVAVRLPFASRADCAYSSYAGIDMIMPFKVRAMGPRGLTVFRCPRGRAVPKSSRTLEAVMLILVSGGLQQSPQLWVS